MSSTRETKIYKNADRARESKSSARQYIPSYQQLGITPEKVGGDKLVGNVILVKGGVTEDNNPRTKKPSLQQPYAEIASTTLSGQIPNVGNSMEHTWSGVDGEIVDDDLSLDFNEPMIDNNDLIEIEDSNINNDFQLANIDEVLSLKEGEYILLVENIIIQTGTLDEIQTIASAIVFGDHPLCEGQSVPFDSLVILKRVVVKVGLFLE